MKICFVTTGDIKEIATAKRALGMANPLKELGWDVHILLQNSEENKSRVNLECNKDINIHYYPKTGILSEVKIKNNLIGNIKPDYVYVCAFVARNFIYKKDLKLLIEHSELQSHISDISVFKKFLSIVLENYSVFKADGLIYASSYLEKYYAKKIKRYRAQTRSLYHPYAYSPIINEVKSLSEISEDFKRLKDRFNFVFLGSITRNYGVFTMLEAIRILNNQARNARLIILGNGPDFDEAVEYCIQHQLSNSVLMPGYIEEEDIKHYFSIADTFISPMNNTIQDWARCPSKLYMYLPYKKPIITCEIGEPPHVLGEAGTYYEVGSSDSLAKSMTHILSAVSKKYADPNLHTWDYRTKEFHQWIKNSF